MKYSIRMTMAVAAAMTLLFGLPNAIGQDADEDESIEEQLSGTFEVDGGKKDARQTINRAIEPLVDDMPFYKQPWAGDKLEAKTVPCASLDISFAGDDIAMECDERPVYRSPMGGEAVQYKAADGSVYRLRQELDGRTLTQTFVSEDGTRTNTYTITPSGKTLLLNATLESGQLPRPLEYNLTYDKK